MKSSRRESAAAGEPLRAFFDPPALHAKLRGARLSQIEDLGADEIAARFAPERAAPSRENGGHFALARDAGSRAGDRADGLSRAYSRAFAWATVRKVNSWMPMSVITSAPSRALTFLISVLVILVRSNVSRWSKSIDGSS